jgi:hypothetical protein
MSKPQKTGSTTRRARCQAERQQRRRKARQKHWRQKQEMKRLALRRAAEEPQPSPTARGYLAQRFWTRPWFESVSPRPVGWLLGASC